MTEESTTKLNYPGKNLFLKLFIKTIPASLLSLTLFIGGIALLFLKIPFWSLFLGLPTTQIGIIFLIFTIDEIARSRVGPESLCIVSCSVCGRPTLTPCGQKKDICSGCQQKIAKKGREEKTQVTS